MRYLTLFAAALLLAACQTDQQDTTTTQQDDADYDQMEQAAEPTSWQGSFEAQEGFAGISGSASAESRGDGTHVTVMLSGAPAGGTHPWHLHQGSCGSGGGIVGDTNAYDALTIGDDMAATSEAHIAPVLDANESYHVNVHASQEDMQTIVACADLSRN